MNQRTTKQSKDRAKTEQRNYLTLSVSMKVCCFESDPSNLGNAASKPYQPNNEPIQQRIKERNILQF